MFVSSWSARIAYIYWVFDGRRFPNFNFDVADAGGISLLYWGSLFDGNEYVTMQTLLLNAFLGIETEAKNSVSGAA